MSSFAAQPPEMPEPTTIASYYVDCIASSLSCVDSEYDVYDLSLRAASGYDERPSPMS